MPTQQWRPSLFWQLGKAVDYLPFSPTQRKSTRIQLLQASPVCGRLGFLGVRPVHKCVQGFGLLRVQQKRFFFLHFIYFRSPPDVRSLSHKNETLGAYKQTCGKYFMRTIIKMYYFHSYSSLCCCGTLEPSIKKREPLQPSPLKKYYSPPYWSEVPP